MESGQIGARKREIRSMLLSEANGYKFGLSAYLELKLNADAHATGHAAFALG